ncbi:MAG: hypothetical protein U0790_21175 [Isosphaeraceae bacterium]
MESFIRSFEGCTLPASEWTHGKHLTMALWYLLRHPRDEATRLIREGIQRYNLSTGNRTGYHETITLAWIAVISEFLENQVRSRPVAELAMELDAACGQKDHLLRYYSRDRLFSSEARRRWVSPDLRPLQGPAKESPAPE